MTAVKSGLMVIDQHRADVRIRYERYMQQLESRTAATSESGPLSRSLSQQVLFPETVQFSPAEAVVLEKMMPSLTAIGFDLSDLGARTFAINGVPAGIEGINPVSLLHEILSDTEDIPSDISSVNCKPSTVNCKPSTVNTPLSAINSHLASRLAQSVAIPYGQVLSNDEMEQIVNELFACSNVNYTPNGKPVLSILPQVEIDRLFDEKG